MIYQLGLEVLVEYWIEKHQLQKDAINKEWPKGETFERNADNMRNFNEFVDSTLLQIRKVIQLAWLN